MEKSFVVGGRLNSEKNKTLEKSRKKKKKLLNFLMVNCFVIFLGTRSSNTRNMVI